MVPVVLLPPQAERMPGGMPRHANTVAAWRTSGHLQRRLQAHLLPLLGGLPAGRQATARHHAAIHSDAAQWVATISYPFGRLGATGATCIARASPANQQLINGIGQSQSSRGTWQGSNRNYNNNAGLLLSDRSGAIRHTSKRASVCMPSPTQPTNPDYRPHQQRRNPPCRLPC